MHMRKRLMFEYADAFVALPGGIDTIEKLAEVITLCKLDRHDKPILIANFEGFWSPGSRSPHLEAEGFLCGSVRARVLVAERADDVLALLGAAPVPADRRGGRPTDARPRRATLVAPAIWAYLNAQMRRIFDMDDRARLPWRFHGRAIGLFAGA